MSKKKEETRAEEEFQHDLYCPFCFFLKTVKESKVKHSEFCNHIYNAQIELLQAFKSLIDARISTLEKKKTYASRSKKATKIEVE